MSAVMMLNYLGEECDDDESAAAGARIRDVYDRALREGMKTRDLGGELSTADFAEAVIARL